MIWENFPGRWQLWSYIYIYRYRYRDWKILNLGQSSCHQLNSLECKSPNPAIAAGRGLGLCSCGLSGRHQVFSASLRGYRPDGTAQGRRATVRVSLEVLSLSSFLASKRLFGFYPYHVTMASGEFLIVWGVGGGRGMRIISFGRSLDSVTVNLYRHHMTSVLEDVPPINCLRSCPATSYTSSRLRSL